MFDQLYPSSNERYSFVLEKVFDRSVIKTSWYNKSEELRNPAIVAIIEQNGTEKEVVLELRKPSHTKTASGTMVLIYRPKTENIKMPN